MFNLTELNKLQEYLMTHNYNCERIDEYEQDCRNDFHQIIVYDNDFHTRLWDAICHRGGHGCELGFLEVYGKMFGEWEIGYLTADDVINIIESKQKTDTFMRRTRNMKNKLCDDCDGFVYDYCSECKVKEKENESERNTGTDDSNTDSE